MSKEVVVILKEHAQFYGMAMGKELIACVAF